MSGTSKQPHQFRVERAGTRITNYLPEYKPNWRVLTSRARHGPSPSPRLRREGAYPSVNGTGGNGHAATEDEWSTAYPLLLCFSLLSFGDQRRQGRTTA